MYQSSEKVPIGTETDDARWRFMTLSEMWGEEIVSPEWTQEEIAALETTLHDYYEHHAEETTQWDFYIDATMGKPLYIATKDVVGISLKAEKCEALVEKLRTFLYEMDEWRQNMHAIGINVKA